jgi:DNA-binding FrmR family transcriptional regulator
MANAALSNGEVSTVHVLTKIFIVLVSLLAVLLVPLVVVYANNENSYKSKFQDAESRALTAQDALKAAEARLGAETSKLNNDVDSLRKENNQFKADKAAAEATARQFESQVAAMTASREQSDAKIGVIAESIKANQQLTETLVNELRQLRGTMVALEREKVELDERLRDVVSQLDVAEQARRALAEELARLKDEHTKTVTLLGDAYAKGFSPGEKGSTPLGVLPDKTLTATIIRVQRNSGQVLAEIDAGSRDGVKKDWIMTIGTNGGYIAKLRIVNVDINRATGTVLQEDPKAGRTVQVGQLAYAFAGQE